MAWAIVAFGQYIEKAIELKNNVFNDNNQIVCSFLSPSGKGVKCLMRTVKPIDLKHYKGLHKAMINSFEKYGYLDDSTKNAVLPMFLSRDKNILHRDFYECTEWFETDYTVPNYANLNKTPTTSNLSVEDKNKFTKKVVNIIKERFSVITGNGHPQVVSTSLILGSRVGADYISKSDAEQLATECIKQNNYLQKNLKGYLKTSMWCINEGIKSPKYF